MRLVHTPSITPTHGWVTSHVRLPDLAVHRRAASSTRASTSPAAWARRSSRAADGEVIYATQKRSLGNAVKLRHGYGIETVYGHLQETLVKSGETVKRGQQIGLMGSTGRSTGPHLHYAVLVNGKAVNPRNYILD